MNEIKEKLLNAASDGAVDSIEVLEKILQYIDDDTLMEVIEDENWDIGIRTFDEYESDD